MSIKKQKPIAQAGRNPIDSPLQDNRPPPLDSPSLDLSFLACSFSVPLSVDSLLICFHVLNHCLRDLALSVAKGDPTRLGMRVAVFR